MDFSTFLKHVDAQEPQRQPTSFSSFLRHAMQDNPEDVKPLLFTILSPFHGTSSVLTSAVDCKLL